MAVEKKDIQSTWDDYVNTVHNIKGGTSGKFLKKSSDDNYDFEWTDVDAIKFTPLEVFRNATYTYFTGDYGSDIKCNRWNINNVLEWRLTNVAPTTIEECEALFE